MKTRQNVLLSRTKDKPNKEVKFLCNSGCSAQDIIISANKIVNQELKNMATKSTP